MTVISTIPRTPSEVTASWMATVLDAPVRRVSIEAIGTGQTGATYRVRLHYGLSAAADLPATVVVKLPSQDDSVRDRVAGGYRAEHAFYRDVANTVAIPTPTVYHCAIDNEGADFVLVMSDQAPARQGDQIAGCDVSTARSAVEALAGLHGPRWCDPAWLDFPEVAMPKADENFAMGMGYLTREAITITVERLSTQLSSEHRDTLGHVGEVVERWLLLEPNRFSPLHGDYRLDNLLFNTDTGAVTVVDWQTLSVGLPSRDLAYFIATSLQPEVRREHERTLVAAYYAALKTYEVQDYTEARCWSDYRLGLLQAPMITTLGFAYAAATDRGDDMVLTMLERSCRALREHDTLRLIQEPGHA